MVGGECRGGRETTSREVERERWTTGRKGDEMRQATEDARAMENGKMAKVVELILIHKCARRVSGGSGVQNKWERQR